MLFAISILRVTPGMNERGGGGADPVTFPLSIVKDVQIRKGTDVPTGRR